MKLRYRSVVATVFVTVLSVSLRGQAAQTEPPPPTDVSREQAVELPKFTVSSERDVSYTGREAIGTTRIGVDLADLAQSVSVINRAFIQDTAPPILIKSLQYVGGVQTGTITWSVDRYLIRGFQGEGDFVDGFKTETDKNTDVNLVDHVEVIKGPAAIFVANQANTVGGVINKISKSPTDYNVGSLTVQWGRYDTNRADLDVGGPITKDKKLQYRFLIGGQDSKSYYDYTYEKRTMYMPMLAYHFNANTEVWVKYEAFNSHYSSYNGIPLAPNGQLMNLPLTANISGDRPTVWRTDDFTRLWGQFTTRPADWVALRFAAFRSTDNQRKVEAIFNATQDWDSTVTDPVTGVNVRVPGYVLPTTNPPGATGPSRSPATYPLLPRNITAVGPWYQPRREIQTDAVFNFDTWSVGHKLLVGATALDYPEKKYIYDSGGTSTATATPLNPLDYGSIKSSANVVSVNFNQPPVQLQDSQQTFSKMYALETASFLKDRVIANWGFSRNRFEASRDTIIYNQVTQTYTNPPTNPAHVPDAVLRKTLVQYGLVVKPLPNVSVFYGNNRNFTSNGFSGQTANPPGEGKQQEVGVKTLWFNNAVGLNLTYFDARSINVPVAAFPQGTTQNVFVPGIISRGFDGDFSVAMSKNLNIFGSYAFFHAKSVLVAPWNLIVQPGDNRVHSEGWMPVNNAANNTFSMFTRYKFTEGMLKNLSAGVGINWQDKRAIDDNSGSKVFYGWLPARTVVDAMFSYDTKTMTYQLNIDNLLDKKYIYASRSSLVMIPASPTNVRLSVTYKFW
jgi:iron complex outermembrane recepter protein